MILTNHSKSIHYESEQVFTDGCCFSAPARHQYFLTPSKIRVYSEPKESKGRKIQLVTPRKGLSQGKETQHTSGTLSHQKITPRYLQKVDPPRSIITFNYSSKSNTEKSSLKNSKVALNSKSKERRQQQLSPCTKIQVSQQYQNRPQVSAPMYLGLEYISEISLVSQEFISQESASNIANLIVQPRANEERKGMQRKRYEVKAQNRRKRMV